MAAAPLKVVVLGHSFVKRAMEHTLLQNLSLSTETHKIFLIGLSGGKAYDLWEYMDQIQAIGPAPGILDIGTNALIHIAPEQLVNLMGKITTHMIKHCQVKSVVCLQVLPRNKSGKFVASAVFRNNIKNYNSLLWVKVYQHHTCSQNPSPLKSWFHKGLRANISEFIAVDVCHLNQEGIAI
jgi:hypothetical protein